MHSIFGSSRKIPQTCGTIQILNPTARLLHHRFRFPSACTNSPSTLAKNSLVSSRSPNARWVGADLSSDNALRHSLIPRSRRNISASSASRQARDHSKCRLQLCVGTMVRSAARAKSAGGTLERALWRVLLVILNALDLIRAIKNLSLVLRAMAGFATPGIFSIGKGSSI